MRCFSMVKVTTSIKIDDEKRNLAKRKGLILSDILDKALDFYLGIELKESTQLQNDKEEILNNLEVLKIEKDKFLKDHEKTLQNLKDEKDQFLKNYLKDHETQLQKLEDDKTEYLKNYETQVMELNYNLKNIEDSLASAVVIDIEEQKEKEYKELFKIVLKDGDIYRNLEVVQAIEDYADKYEMTEEEYKELQQRLLYDLADPNTYL